MGINKELLKKARALAVKEATLEFINENRDVIIKRARPKVAPAYEKLALTSWPLVGEK